MQERLLAERAENIRLQEDEIAKREDKLRRWEREMQRLESQVARETDKATSVQSDYERLRSMRVDDALLIEKLRAAQTEVQDQLNELVGCLAAFSVSLDQLAKDQSVDSLRNSILRLRPLKSADENLDALREIRHCLQGLLVYTKNLGELSGRRDLSPP